jgi:hypothetical protein
MLEVTLAVILFATHVTADPVIGRLAWYTSQYQPTSGWNCDVHIEYEFPEGSSLSGLYNRGHPMVAASAAPAPGDPLVVCELQYPTSCRPDSLRGTLPAGCSDPTLRYLSGSVSGASSDFADVWACPESDISFSGPVFRNFSQGGSPSIFAFGGCGDLGLNEVEVDATLAADAGVAPVIEFYSPNPDQLLPWADFLSAANPVQSVDRYCTASDQMHSSFVSQQVLLPSCHMGQAVNELKDMMVFPNKCVQFDGAVVDAEPWGAYVSSDAAWETRIGVKLAPKEMSSQSTPCPTGFGGGLRATRPVRGEPSLKSFTMPSPAGSVSGEPANPESRSQTVSGELANPMSRSRTVSRSRSLTETGSVVKPPAGLYPPGNSTLKGVVIGISNCGGVKLNYKLYRLVGEFWVPICTEGSPFVDIGQSEFCSLIGGSPSGNCFTQSSSCAVGQKALYAPPLNTTQVVPGTAPPKAGIGVTCV